MTETAADTLATHPRHKFLALDGLRGVACMSVVLFHYTGALFGNSWHWPPQAYLAIDFFFMLSGFVIAHAYDNRLRAGMTLKQFTTLRLIRLYPLYALGTTILITAPYTQTSPLFPLAYILNMLFLPAPYLASPTESGGMLFQYNHPAWSLSLEFAINLLFVVFYAKLTNRRIKPLLALSAAGIIAVFATHTENSWNLHDYWSGWIRVTFAFLTGILLHRRFVARQPKTIRTPHACLLPLTLLLILSMPDLGPAWPILSILAFFPLIVWFGARAAIAKPLAALCTWAGRLSYALYITHRPLFDIFTRFSQKLGYDSHAHARLSALLFTACALLTAILLDRFYDLPLRAWLTDKLTKKSTHHNPTKVPLPLGLGEEPRPGQG